MAKNSLKHNWGIWMLALIVVIGIFFIVHAFAYPTSHFDYQCTVNSDSTCNCFVSPDSVMKFGLNNQYLNIVSNNDIYLCEKNFVTIITADSNDACGVSEKNIYPPQSGYFDVKCR